MARKASVPLDKLHETLRAYQAVLHRDVSTEKGHIYFSSPLQQWILVQRKGENVNLTFSAECPCSKL